jgi:hypothetical protein
MYRIADFNRFDGGFTFGFSVEHRSYYARFRSFSGIANTMQGVQGMAHSLHLEIGYFMFRNLRKF